MAGITRFIKTIQEYGNKAEILDFYKLPKEEWINKEYPECAILLIFPINKDHKETHITMFHDYGSDIRISKIKYNRNKNYNRNIVTLKYEGNCGIVFVSEKNKTIDLPVVKDIYMKPDKSIDVSDSRLLNYPKDFDEITSNWFKNYKTEEIIRKR